MDLWDENEELLLAAAEKFRTEELRKQKELAEAEEAEAKRNSAMAPAASFADIARDLVDKVPALQKLLTADTEKALIAKTNNAKRALADAVASAAGKIDPEQLDGVTFFTEYAKAQDIAMRLVNEKKVGYICNLFVNSFLSETQQAETDVYESYLNAIQTLTSKELELLMSLSRFENESDLFFMDPYSNMKVEAMQKWNMGEMQLESMMKKLAGMGFCEKVSADFFGYDGGVYETTEYCQNFLLYITNK